MILTILGCVLGVLGLILDRGGVPKTAPARHFGPGGSLKQPQHVKKVKTNSDQKMRTGNAGLKRVILTIFGCFLGVLGLILDPGGVPKTAPARQKSQK